MINAEIIPFAQRISDLYKMPLRELLSTRHNHPPLVSVDVTSYVMTTSEFSIIDEEEAFGLQEALKILEEVKMCKH
jgi:hypothetical protein